MIRFNNNKKGAAVLLITVTVLILSTMILIFAFQNSAINILIGKNLLDKTGAVKSAQACEQKQIADMLGVGGAVDALPSSPYPTINCASSRPASLGAFFIPGNSKTGFITNRYRITSQGTGNQLSKANLTTDVLITTNTGGST